MTPGKTTKFASAFVLILLPLPLVIVIGASLSPDRVLSFPPKALSLIWYEALWQDTRWILNLGYSALLATVVAGLTVLVAACAAIGMRGLPEKRSSTLEAIILLPLLFPNAALALGFVGWFLALGLHGGWFSIFIAHTVLCLPFAYRPIAVGVKQVDASMMEAAYSLGASSFQAIWKVYLPLMRPGMVAGFVFAFIVSFDEVNVTMFLVGLDTSTLPVKIYSHLQDSADPVTAAASSVLIVLSIVAVLVLEKFVGLQMFVSADDSRASATK